MEQVSLARYVVKELVDSGEEVIAADWMPDPAGLGHLGLDKKVRVVKVDILDYQALLSAIKENNVTHIANLANARELSKIEPKEQRACSRRGLGGNSGKCRGNKECFRSGKNPRYRASSIHQFHRCIWQSSSNGKAAKRRRIPAAPVITGYVAKRLGEMICEEYSEIYDLDCLTVRFGGQVYGPRLFRERSGQKGIYPDRLFDAIVDLFDNGALGRNCRVTEPDYLKSWLYVKDAGRSVHYGFKARDLKHRLFIAAGFVHSNKEVAEMVKRYVKDCKVEYVQSGVDRWDKRILPGWKHAYDFSKAKTELGWEPIYDIDRAVHEWVNYQRKQAGVPPV